MYVRTYICMYVIHIYIYTCLSRYHNPQKPGIRTVGSYQSSSFVALDNLTKLDAGLT